MELFAEGYLRPPAAAYTEAAACPPGVAAKARDGRTLAQADAGGSWQRQAAGGAAGAALDLLS